MLRFSSKHNFGLASRFSVWITLEDSLDSLHILISISVRKTPLAYHSTEQVLEDPEENKNKLHPYYFDMTFACYI